jgi:dinuclear metal center YbgI/SA1388 family protein
MDFDNVGLLVGHRDQVVSTALLALDITPEVLQEAYANNAQLVISHHPVIFDPLKQLTYNHPAYMLAAMHLSAICAHTNLDMAAEGVNAVLARKLGLVNVTGIEKYGDCDEALMGELQTDMAPEGFAAYVRDCLDCGSVQLVNGGKTVRKVALCGGAGGSLLSSALRAGADAFVTGEAKHNQMLDAKAAGLTLVAAGHHHTEQPVMENLQKILAQKFPQVEFLLSECGTAPSVSL